MVRKKETIKCVGCHELNRAFQPVVYNCRRGGFPYWCALSGLLMPSRGIEMAASVCPMVIADHCSVCGKKPSQNYGQNLVFVCDKHDKDWGKWLDAHQERREYIHPRSRVLKSRWIEVFREFVAEAQKEV